MLEHIELIDKHVSDLRRLIIIATHIVSVLTMSLAIVSILVYQAISTRFTEQASIDTIISERLDRNYLVIKELREATIEHCKTAHSFELKLQDPEDKPNGAR